MGLLETLADRLAAIEAALAELSAKVRAPALPPGVAFTPDEGLLSLGAMDLKAAEEFSGLSRSELYRRMDDGSLPWLVVTRERMVPRLALVRLLAAKRAETAARGEPAAAGR